MKYLVQLCRILVGVTFIISGMIKLNDPMGFSFKLEDYFAPDVLNMPFFAPYALVFAIFVCIFEVVLGITLLVGYKKKLTLWLLLAMLVFFGFLTFYSAYFNKVTDCGCFGDAIKFTPWQSFTKDIVLLVLALIVFWGQKYIQPITKGNLPLIITTASVLFCIVFVYYVYNHLPIKDFRAYKIGTNIPKGMELPTNAVTYYWTFKVDGQDKVIVTKDASFPKVDGEYVSSTSTTELPPIHDFYIQDKDRETDYLDEFMAKDKLIMVVAYRLDRADQDAFKAIKKVTDRAMKNGYTVIGLTSQMDKAPEIVKKYELNFNFYYNDAITLKTMIRSNPGLITLSKGTILDKKHYNDSEKLLIK